MPTATPLTFGTNGVIPVFGATEFGSYAGATCASGFVTVVSAAGAVTCATPVPATPQPTPTSVSTATPQPTVTPVSPSYRHTLSTASGATNLTTAGAANTGGFGFSSMGNTESIREMPIAIAVTAKNLYCYWAIAPASGKTWTATLRSGTCAGTMSDSTVTCTLTGNGSLQTCSDTTHSLAVSANQCATVNIVASGTPTATNAVCNYEIDP